MRTGIEIPVYKTIIFNLDSTNANCFLEKHASGIFFIGEQLVNYCQKFSAYPDVVTLPQFCEMLGGIADGTARKLIRNNNVQHFCIRHTYLIPKDSVIEYVMSEHYLEYQKLLRHQI